MVDEHRDLLTALQSRDRKLMLAQLERHIAVPVPDSVPRNANGTPGAATRRGAKTTPRKGKA